MKRIIYITILLSLYNFSFAQDSTLTLVKAKFNGDFYDYFGKKLTYPPYLALKGIQGNTIISFNLNEKGYLDSINVLSTPNTYLSQEAVDALRQTSGKWTPTTLNGDPIKKKYKLVIIYRIVESAPPKKEKSEFLKEKSVKKLNDGKYEDALSKINEAIALNPFVSEYYQVRSKIYNALGEVEKSKEDYTTSINTERDIISVLEILSYISVQLTTS